VSRAVVCDASAVVALLLDGGHAGRWATAALTGTDLAAPSLIGFEAANIIRRHERGGLISPDQAAQAHTDLLELTIEEWPYELLAGRAWELRHNLSMYDASYVAVAEHLSSTLVTLDQRISAAPGVRCTVSTP
jgi:predicted nucleic acid-binding protein